MSATRKKVRQYVLFIGAVLAWLAVLLQLYLIIVNRTTSLPETIIRFFSFFTIQNNMIVATYFSVLLRAKEGQLLRFFSKAQVATAITVYITIVGLVYQIVLRPLWAPEGLQYLADELLHSVIPVYALLFWALSADKRGLYYQNMPKWLVYPLIYLIYTLIRGYFAKYYPYPFVDVEQLGMGNVLLNSAVLLLLFSLLSLVFILIGKSILRLASSK